MAFEAPDLSAAAGKLSGLASRLPQWELEAPQLPALPRLPGLPKAPPEIVLEAPDLGALRTQLGQLSSQQVANLQEAVSRVLPQARQRGQQEQGQAAAAAAAPAPQQAPQRAQQQTQAATAPSPPAAQQEHGEQLGQERQAAQTAEGPAAAAATPEAACSRGLVPRALERMQAALPAVQPVNLGKRVERRGACGCAAGGAWRASKRAGGNERVLFVGRVPQSCPFASLPRCACRAARLAAGRPDCLRLGSAGLLGSACCPRREGPAGGCGVW